MFSLQLDTDNDAFGPHLRTQAAELGRMLRLVAMSLENGKTEGAVMAFNGNAVGQWKLTEGGESANARLIAAAPDLLEALKDLMRRLPTYCGNDPKALAAIAKAEGRDE